MSTKLPAPPPSRGTSYRAHCRQRLEQHAARAFSLAAFAALLRGHQKKHPNTSSLRYL